MRFENKVLINADVELVFRYLYDLHNFPKWNYAVTAVKCLNSFHDGKRLYGIYRKFEGPRYEEGFVKECLENKFLCVRVMGRWFDYELEYHLTERVSETEVINVVRLFPRWMLYFPVLLLKGTFQRAVARNLLVLKKVLQVGKVSIIN